MCIRSVNGRKPSRALLLAHALVGFSGASLALVVLTLALPWVGISVDGVVLVPEGPAEISTTFVYSVWVVGFFTFVDSVSFIGLTQSLSNSVQWLGNPNAFSEPTSDDPFLELFSPDDGAALYRGLIAGLGCILASVVVAIAAVVVAAIVLRQLPGGTRLCCGECNERGAAGNGTLKRLRWNVSAAALLLLLEASLSIAAAVVVGQGSFLFYQDLETLTSAGFQVLASAAGIGMAAFSATCAFVGVAVAIILLCILTADDLADASVREFGPGTSSINVLQRVPAAAQAGQIIPIATVVSPPPVTFAGSSVEPPLPLPAAAFSATDPVEPPGIARQKPAEDWR